MHGKAITNRLAYKVGLTLYANPHPHAREVKVTYVTGYGGDPLCFPSQAQKPSLL
jgi:hypothetical protein